MRGGGGRGERRDQTTSEEMNGAAAATTEGMKTGRARAGRAEDGGEREGDRGREGESVMSPRHLGPFIKDV